MSDRGRGRLHAFAAVRSEGFAPNAAAAAVVEQWARGELSTAQMRELVRRVHDNP
ncbi:hypothetical protein [Nocardia sp. NPDC049149]|uniref:antitoxin VbhA family protein n=1 Tax=Nocardia sp. NPDC049149 TaxID=3364315 RepID=UPI00371FE772